MPMAKALLVVAVLALLSGRVSSGIAEPSVDPNAYSGCYGYCGIQADGCYCDDICLPSGDCCADYQQACQDSSDAPRGLFFDCHRPNATCNNGTCDGPQCACDAGFTNVQGYACVAAASVASPCLSETCMNGGQCFTDTTGDFQDAGDEVCFCPQNFAGPRCQYPRFQTSCTENGMLLIYRPFPDFTGRVFAVGHDSNGTCMFQKSVDLQFSSSHWSYYAWSNNFPLNTCGMTRYVLPDGSVRFELNVMIQNYVVQPDLMTSTDQILLASCTFAPNRTVSREAIVEVAYEQGGNSVGGDITNLVTMDIVDSTDTSLSQASVVTISSPLELKITVRLNNVFNHFLLDSCVASNVANSQAASYASIAVVDVGGCPSNTVIVRGNHTEETTATTATAVVPVRALMFSANSANGQNELHFTCVVRLCNNQSQAACDGSSPDTCSNPAFTGGLGRRRRRAADNTIETVVQGSVRVVFGEQTSANGKSSAVITSECLNKPHFQNLIIILSVLIFVLLIACVVFVVLMFMQNRKQKREHSKK